MYIPYQTETCQGQDGLRIFIAFRSGRSGGANGLGQYLAAGKGPGEGGGAGRETGGNAVTARLAIPLSAVRVTKNKENTAAS